ncbi:glycosyltransferase family 2 protein [Patescibacteria group bacterium]|nr:glycosyltransferase family 2 protein [Patescibacteria group bacterium]MBU4511764.1 glycosyltransferase family 2 protein [Patescibacteria group bacterium]
MEYEDKKIRNFDKSGAREKEPGLSIVIPIYNEEEVLDMLFARLKKSLGDIPIDYEVLFVDDGSHDGSLGMLKKFYQLDRRFKTVSFSRNFGHQVAISAGLDFARGQAVVIMDGDLQDPPELIASMINKWQEGYRVVYAIRKKRREGLFKRVAYKIFYRLLRSAAKIDIPLDSGDFCLMDKSVVELINSLPERTRFIRGLRSWVGFKQIGLEYERDKRFAGKPKYTFSKLLILALDGVLSFSEDSLRSVLFVGFIVSVFSFFLALLVVSLRIFGLFEQITGWTTIVAIITFLGGVQLMVAGFIGEYITRIFEEVKRRPLYITDEKIGIGDKDK